MRFRSSTKFVFVSIAFMFCTSLFGVCSAINCQGSVYKKCNRASNLQFQNAQNPATKENNQIYCSSVQSLINCLSNTPCSGSFIDRYKLLVSQAAIMSKKMMCTTLNYASLKNKTEGLATQLGLTNLESIDGDSCAVNVFKGCAFVFSNTMQKNQNFCQDFEKTIQCFEKRKKKCPKSLILSEYIKILKSLGIRQVIKPAEKATQNICGKI